MGIKQQKRNNETKFGVHVLVVIFGITSWTIMNGLWVELPILVSHLPEGWTLPSYLTIITQFGNIGIILFTVINYCKPKTKLETPTSFIIVTALTLCALLYSFFWKGTAYVAGDYYSVALLTLTFSQSIFAATTSIAYVTFMAHLKESYMANIFIGMGLSGLIPAFAAIGQGMGYVRCVNNTNTSLAVSKGYNGGNQDMNITKSNASDSLIVINEEPPFSVQGFFLLLFGIGVLSLLSLLMLVYHPYCKTEHVDSEKEENCLLMQANSNHETANTAQNDILRRVTESTPHTSTGNREISSGHEHFPDANNIPLSEITGDQNALDITDANPSSLVPNPGDQAANGTLAFYETSASLNPIMKNTAPNIGTHPKNTNLNMEKHVSKETENTAENSDVSKDAESEKSDEKSLDQGRKITKLESWYLLGLLVWINALQTSFVLAIQVYSSLPYGLKFYHGATKAENIVDPIASFLTFWIAANTTLVISGLTLLGTLFIAYIITVAAMSPNPFLVNETAGGALVITAWVMCTMLMVFSKVSIAKVMRSQGRLSLMWTGASTQAGTTLGAILAYVVINGLHLFKDEPWCR